LGSILTFSTPAAFYGLQRVAQRCEPGGHFQDVGTQVS